jgi:hypothetical protein
MYDINTFQLHSEWRGASKTPTDAIVGLEFAHNRLYTCSAQGRLVVRNLKDNDGEFNYWHSSIKEPVSAFRVHPMQQDVIATGGKDKDLEVMELYNNQAEMRNFGESRPHWILQALQADDSPIHQRVRTKWHAKTARYQLGSNNNRYRNSTNGDIDIDPAGQYPIWISDIQFLNLKQPQRLGWRIATTTRYGYINIYETSISRLCVFSVLASNYPLVNLWFGGNEHELIYTDSQYGVGVFDSVSGKLLKMKGEAGSSLVHVHAMYREANNSELLAFPEVTETRIGSLQRTAVESDLEEEIDDEVDTNTIINNTTTTTSTILTTTIAENANDDNNTMVSPPIMKPLLVSGGLDKYLRVYDLEVANMVAKVRTRDKVSALWVIDATNSSFKRRRSLHDAESAKLVSSYAEEEERESKRARNETDVCME